MTTKFWFQVLALSVTLFCFTAAKFDREKEESLGGFNKLILQQPAGDPNKNCQLPFTKNAKSCYYVSKTKANYFEASEFCRAQQTQLVSIETSKENAFLKKLLNQSVVDHMDFAWTSGEDMGSEGAWTWMGSGELLNFTDWSYRNPDNYQGVEHCLQMPVAHGFQWNDALCTMEGHFVCEVGVGQPTGSSVSCIKVALKLMDMVKATVIKYVDKVDQ